MQLFDDMKWKVLPRTIVGMGRDGRSEVANKHFHGFLRSIPFFDGVV